MNNEQYKIIKRLNKTLIAAKAAVDDIREDERIRMNYSPESSPQFRLALENVHNLNSLKLAEAIDLTRQIIKDNKERLTR